MSAVDFRAEPVLADLKDFQRATVEHAFDRLFLAPDSTRRFLVADEVGLGKTLVAKGIVAKTIEHLHEEGVERIDVVYICSNADIAGQNVRKLDVTGQGAPIASRLTLLAKQISGMRERDVNVLALTPGTSFNQTGGGGVAAERVLLYWLLRDVWGLGDQTAPKNLLQGGVGRERFRARLRWFDRAQIDGFVTRQFARALDARGAEDLRAGRQPIRMRFDELCEDFARARDRYPKEVSRGRARIVGELRGLLAAACVETLEPDLVVLDEFQRFKHLLEEDQESEAASLAHSLFNWRNDENGEHARVLMLSATPYRMYTVAGDGGGDDHHEDFLATVRFLADDPRRVDDLRSLLREYRSALYELSPDDGSGVLTDACTRIEQLLKNYIARTERIGAAGQHDAMLKQVSRSCEPLHDDLRQYLMVQDIAEELGHHDLTELWKSAPYLLNFLDGYQLRKRFDARSARADTAKELAEHFVDRDDLLLRRSDLETYAAVDPGGPRLRVLSEDVIDSGAWRLLWVPPSMPYHELGGAYADPRLEGFTKRLIFSSWRAAPRAIAGILSYAAERELVRAGDPAAQNTSERRASQRSRLSFAVDGSGRLTGMPALALLYPSVQLAAAADPRLFATEQPAGSLAQLREWALRQVSPLLDGLPTGPQDGDVDERWYWAAPLLLDRDVSGSWWRHRDLAWEWSAADKRANEEGSRWGEHVNLARQAANGELKLGRRPADLAAVLAELALGAPGQVALRALARSCALPLEDDDLRVPAAKVAWALRGLFNTPEATALLRPRLRSDATFWQTVLEYAIEGGLQAVLDEQAHVLVEAEGVQDKSDAECAAKVADAMGRSLGLRSSRVTWSSIDLSDGAVAARTERLYTSFATRFGEDEGGAATTDGEAPARSGQLREAFNSPFWPFVLASTSVGQEGLDFHPYCHVVVHWNLPNNPVDLEQREGRVHRFKGHAIRKNVARRHGSSALQGAGDPWVHAFAAAAAGRLATDSDLVPYWIYPVENGAVVERHVLALPLSRELHRLEALRNALAIYRLAFGQARQEDVLDHLLTRLGPERAAAVAAEARIDLRPANQMP